MTAAWVKDGEGHLSIIQELVAKESSSITDDESIMALMAKFHTLEGFRTLLTNLKKAQASTPDISEMVDKLVTANGQLTKWVYDVVCPHLLEILAGIQKHTEGHMVLDFDAQTTVLAEAYSKLDPSSMGYPVPLPMHQLKLLCAWTKDDR